MEGGSASRPRRDEDGGDGEAAGPEAIDHRVVRDRDGIRDGHSRIVQEEPFGPVLPIIAYDDIEDVIARANQTPLGLAASVWGRDKAKAYEIASRLEAGTVWVNEIHIHGIDIPFGGHKQSGLGVENGREGLSEYTNTKVVMTAR